MDTTLRDGQTYRLPDGRIVEAALGIDTDERDTWVLALPGEDETTTFDVGRDGRSILCLGEPTDWTIDDLEVSSVVPSVDDLWDIMLTAGIDQDEAVRRLGGQP